MEGLWTSLRRVGLGAGLDRIGVASANPFPDVRADLENRRQTGLHGGLTFTYNRPGRSTDIRASFPWAMRLVVAGRSYLPEAGCPGPAAEGTGRIARFAAEDSYRPLRSGLEMIAGLLVAEGFRAEILMDDNRLVDRAVAVRAGVGWWGKNSMVLAPRVGPWMLLGSVVTDAILPTSRPMTRDCGTCSACLPACPTGALVAPGILDARRCLAAWAQLPGMIPIEYRTAMGDRLYGCDECIEVCPPGNRARETATMEKGRVDLVELLALTDQEIAKRFGRFYLPGRRGSVLRRNALVALGNTGGPEHAGVIAKELDHADPVVRAHAAWALGELGGSEASAALDQAIADETDPIVSAELATARRDPL